MKEILPLSYFGDRFIHFIGTVGRVTMSFFQPSNRPF